MTTPDRLGSRHGKSSESDGETWMECAEENALRGPTDVGRPPPLQNVIAHVE